MAKPILNQFNGGEISSWLEGRIDLQKYPYSARLMRNFIPLVEGSVVRRGGSHFVSSCKEEDAVLFKIVADPSEAEIYINNELCEEIYCAVGEKVSYSVAMEGYQTITGTHIVEEDTTLYLQLVSRLNRSTITVKSIPEGADIFINGIPTDRATVLRGSIAYYEAIKSGYDPAKGQVQVNNDIEVVVPLKMSFEIKPTPKDAVVTINGEKQNRVSVMPGDVVTWSVERSGYESQSGSETIEQSVVRYIDLSSGNYEINQTVFEKTVPGRYYIVIKQTGWYDVSICSAGGGGGGSPYKYEHQGTDGASGAAYRGQMYLVKGNYFIKVGVGGKGGQASGKNATSGLPLVYNPQSILDGVSAIIYKDDPNGLNIQLDPGYGGRGTGDYGSTTEKGGVFYLFRAVNDRNRMIKSNGKIRSTLSILGNGYGAGGKAAALGGHDGTDGTGGYCKLVYLGLA